MSDCGCYVDVHGWTQKNKLGARIPAGKFIKFCPVHSEAFNLLAVAKHASHGLKMKRHSEPDNCPSCNDLIEVVARAEGKDK